MKISQITEDKNSAALHVVNAKFAQLFEDLVELARNADAERILHPGELLNNLHALIRKHDRKLQLTKGIGEDRYDDDKQFGAYTNEDKEGFSQFVVDFDGALDDTLQSYWTQAEIDYGTDSQLSPEQEAAMERVVSSYCKQCNV